jgi:hypothetical protein
MPAPADRYYWRKAKIDKIVYNNKKDRKKRSTG